MRYFTCLGILALVLVATASCGKLRPGFNTYDIEYSGKVTFDRDNQIYFRDVADSRCPIGAACIEPGEAVISFEALESGRDTIQFDLHLGIDPSGPIDTVIFDKYRIELLDVIPEPVAGEEFIKENYLARFLVDKFKR